MKPRHLLLGAALLVAAALALFGERSSERDRDNGIAEPTPHVPHMPRKTNIASTPAADIAAVSARATLYPASRPTSGPGLFAGQSWQPAQPRPTAARPLPPSAPPLPFVYLGKKHEDGSWEIYLGRGEESLIVRDKTVIDGTWRIDAIAPPTMTITYLPLHQTQLLIIGGTD